MKHALEKGHEVTAFVRNPSKLQIQHENLKIVQGDVRSVEDVEKAVKAQNVVLSCLGVKLGQKPICAEGTKNIIRAMKKRDVKRIVVESAYGAGKTRKKGLYACLLRLAIKPLLKDKEAMEDLLQKSGLDWTVVQPTILTNGPLTTKYRADTNLKVGWLPKISRADVADFMLKVAEQGKFLREVVIVSY